MTVHSRERNSDLKVVFADLNLDHSKALGPVFDSTLMLWPRQVFDAAPLTLVPYSVAK
jgi:hypothetical protein